jgi:hypothetical protein
MPYQRGEKHLMGRWRQHLLQAVRHRDPPSINEGAICLTPRAMPSTISAADAPTTLWLEITRPERPDRFKQQS